MWEAGSLLAGSVVDADGCILFVICDQQQQQPVEVRTQRPNSWAREETRRTRQQPRHQRATGRGVRSCGGVAQRAILVLAEGKATGGCSGRRSHGRARSCDSNHTRGAPARPRRCTASRRRRLGEATMRHIYLTEIAQSQQGQLHACSSTTCRLPTSSHSRRTRSPRSRRGTSCSTNDCDRSTPTTPRPRETRRTLMAHSRRSASSTASGFVTSPTADQYGC
jgi:hypothetical protein